MSPEQKWQAIERQLEQVRNQNAGVIEFMSFDEMVASQKLSAYSADNNGEFHKFVSLEAGLTEEFLTSGKEHPLWQTHAFFLALAPDGESIVMFSSYKYGNNYVHKLEIDENGAPILPQERFEDAHALYITKTPPKVIDAWVQESKFRGRYHGHQTGISVEEQPTNQAG